jgi:hypothetical protein
MPPRHGDQNFSCALHIQYIKIEALIGVVTVKKLESDLQFTHGEKFLLSFNTSPHHAS